MQLMNTFQDYGLNPKILEGLKAIEFKQPTPIQDKVIPHLINSEKDLIALAQTGTGKTAAFSLPIIQQLDTSKKHVQSLILCPTRELALQITSDIEKFIKYSSDISTLAVYGGERIEKQIRALKKKPQIIVGTPGRVNDFIRRGLLKVELIKWLVLDEADEMLNMGFKDDLDDILKNMPSSKQVLLFSATMNKQVRRIANNYMKKPEDITVGNKNQGADNVQHFYYVVNEKDRYQALKRIADINLNIHGIVFCRTRRETQQVADQLIQDNYSAEAIHGEISQEQRTKVMNKFRNKKIQILVATDVAARGIDVDKLTHIINYNLPESGEAYLHRSGRTGRANNEGISIVIVSMREKYRIRDLERKIGKPIEKARIPSGDDICEKQLYNLVEKITNVEVNEDQIGKYVDLISKKFENIEKDDLVKKFISMEFNRFIDHYKNSVDLNSLKNEGKNHQYDKSSILFTRFRINVGRDLGLTVPDILKFLNKSPGLKRAEIGNIDIRNDCTFFELDERFKSKVLDYCKNAEVNGTKVEITCKESGVSSSRQQNNYRKGRGRGGYGGRNRNQSRSRNQGRGKRKQYK